jgi:hypothetical protein
VDDEQRKRLAALYIDECTLIQSITEAAAQLVAAYEAEATEPVRVMLHEQAEGLAFELVDLRVLIRQTEATR